ncbi:MAG: thermonuclease family protein, partial [Clostridia bacterium]|nr:thermonuclease family protein [Clostridia bacterium]
RRLSGRNVWLELDVEERDKYGRLLAYVWTEPPQSGSESEVRAKMFNAELLLAGMAQVMTVPPNVKYADMFLKFQREAREAGKGLWASGAASPSGFGAAAASGKYIGNASSKKFHRPDCEWAAKIASKNRVEFTTREAAIAAGYEPCKVCRP